MAALSITHDTAAVLAGGATQGEVAGLLRLEGAAVLVTAASTYYAIHGTGWLFALLFLTPDLSMLGYLVTPRVGARAYNAGHSYLSPAILAALGVIGHWPAMIPLALIWCAHIGFDRLLGYGLKYPWSFQATHLGRLGRRTGAA